MRLSTFALIWCCSLSSLSASALTVESAVSQFMERNYDLHIAKGETDKARAALITAQERPNPTLSASYEFINVEHRFSDTSTGSNAQATLILSHPIETAGKRDRRIDLANRTIEWSDVAYEETARNRLGELIDAFYTVVRDETERSNALENAAAYANVVAIAKAKYDNGFLSQVDYQKIALQQVDYAGEIENASLSLERDRETLAALLAIPASQLPEAIAPEGDDAPLPPLESALQHLSERPDCKAAKATVAVADAAWKLEKANAVPNVSVGAEYASFGPDYQPLLGVNFSIPLPVYDRNEGEIERTRIETLQANENYAKTLRTAEMEVAQSHASLRSRQNLYRIVSEGFTAARDLKERQEKVFALKGISVLELLDAQKNYRDYQRNLTRARTDLQIARTRFNLITGSLQPLDKGL